MNILLTYNSKYGHTKKFADWIAEELHTTSYSFDKVDKTMIDKADTIVYGAGIYVFSVNIPQIIKDNADKNLVLFIVGASNPKDTDYTEVYNKSIPSELKDKIKIFHFQAGINYKKLSIMHKIMMRMIKSKFDEELEKNYSDQLKYSLDNYYNEYDFSNREDIADLINYVKNI